MKNRVINSLTEYLRDIKLNSNFFDRNSNSYYLSSLGLIFYQDASKPKIFEKEFSNSLNKVKLTRDNNLENHIKKFGVLIPIKPNKKTLNCIDEYYYEILKKSMESILNKGYVTLNGLIVSEKFIGINYASSLGFLKFPRPRTINLCLKFNPYFRKLK